MEVKTNKDSRLPLDDIEVMEDELTFVLGGAAMTNVGPGEGCGCGCASGSGRGCGCDSGKGCGCECASGFGCGCGCSDSGQSSAE